MEGKRIFVAIDISDAARAACHAHIELLRKQFPAVRVGWERPEKLHITLKFLGNTEADILEDLKSGIVKSAFQIPPFKLNLSQTGVFPTTSRPRILWIGVSDPVGALIPIHSQIEAHCRDLGFQPD